MFVVSSRRAAAAVLSLVSFLFLTAPASAQTITGTVIGTVTDQSGAVIAGAAVTATNITTGVATRSVANDQGLYSIRFLPIGPYTIAVTAVGFTTTSVGPFSLEIDQNAKIDLNLRIGNAATTVHVASDVSPVLRTQDATLESTIGSGALAT